MSDSKRGKMLVKLQTLTEGLKDSVRAEFVALEVKRLTERIKYLEDQNEQLRAALKLSAEINPYGAKNAEARDMARALLYQVPALPWNKDDDKLVEDLVRERGAKNPESGRKLKKRED